MNRAPSRDKQVLAVTQLLKGHPLGMQQQQLMSLLGRHADRAQLLATLNTMVCYGLAVRLRGRGPHRYVLATEHTGAAPAAANDSVHLSEVLRSDQARARAAAGGIVAPMPPRMRTAQAETVDEWMARTGKQPQIISNNFDKPLDHYPGRRPSMPRFIC